MYKKVTNSWIKHIDFLILDLICLELSFAIAYIVRHGIYRNMRLPLLYTNVAVILVLIELLESIYFNELQNVYKRGHYEEYRATFEHSTIVTLMLVVYLYMTQQAQSYSRIVFVLTWAFDIIFTYVVREIRKWHTVKSIKHNKNANESMIIITYKKDAEDLVKNITKNNYNHLLIRGICVLDENLEGQSINKIPVISNKDGILDYLCRNWVDEVFVNIPDIHDDIEEKVVEHCMMMGITVHQNLFRTIELKGNKMVEEVNGYTVLSSSIKMVSVRQLIVKRIMDIVGALVGMTVTAILFIFIAPIIYIKSPGPIFFKQWRVGRNGKKFQIYKFRSMYPDAEERKKELMAKNKIKDGMMFKMDNDPRIIGGENGKGIGNFIRNTSIDEFPQFLNVLKGDMSLVGTRPPTVDEWDKYELHHRARLAIKPGLTGMWQVSGRSDITDFEEVVKLDTDYIMNWSVGKDVAILMKTVWVVIRGKGSC